MCDNGLQRFDKCLIVTGTRQSRGPTRVLGKQAQCTSNGSSNNLAGVILINADAARCWQAPEVSEVSL